MKSSFQLQKTKNLLFLFWVFFASLNVQAQTKRGFEYQSTCLNANFSSIGVDSVCESVSWFINNSNTPVSNDYTFKYSFSKAGTYTVCMKVNNSCKRYDTLYCRSVVITDCNGCDSVKTGWSIKADTVICGKFKFNAYTENKNAQNVSYAYTFGDGTSSTNKDPSNTYLKNGNHQACVTVKFEYNGAACSKQYCETLKVTCHETAQNCTWKETNMYVSNQCNVWSFYAPLYADSCMTYKWTVNGVVKETRSASFTMEKKDSLFVCLRLKNSCTGCDTTICKQFYNDCLPNQNNRCKWENIGTGHSASNTQCGKVIFEATAQKDTCIKTEYYANGKWIPGRIYDYNYTQNGTYTYVFRFKNTCTGCDTVVYNKVEIGCFKETKTCDWSKFNFNYRSYADSKQENCYKYLFEATNFEDSCIVQKIKITQENNILFQETGRIVDYTFKNNGYYTVCYWAKNECLNCDTWVCKTIYVNCEKADIQKEDKFSISLAPNPVQDMLYINNNQAVFVELFNIYGQKAFDQKLGINGVLNVSSLPTATYILKLYEPSGKIRSIKIIKD